jgi:hypothetical protein
MPQPSSDTRFGALKARHGTTQIGILRSRYGTQFARGCSDSETLGECLHKWTRPTLTKLLAAHDSGELEKICRGAGQIRNRSGAPPCGL